MSQTEENKNNTTAIPKMGETDDIPLDDKKIHQVWKESSVNFIWFIAELDKDGNGAYGYANLNADFDADWGYISIDEIKGIGAKLVDTKVQSFKEALQKFKPELAAKNTVGGIV